MVQVLVVVASVSTPAFFALFAEAQRLPVSAYNNNKYYHSNSNDGIASTTSISISISSGTTSGKTSGKTSSTTTAGRTNRNSNSNDAVVVDDPTRMQPNLPAVLPSECVEHLDDLIPCWLENLDECANCAASTSTPSSSMSSFLEHFRPPDVQETLALLAPEHHHHPFRYNQSHTDEYTNTDETCPRLRAPICPIANCCSSCEEFVLELYECWLLVDLLAGLEERTTAAAAATEHEHKDEHKDGNDHDDRDYERELELELQDDEPQDDVFVVGGGDDNNNNNTSNNETTTTTTTHTTATATITADDLIRLLTDDCALDCYNATGAH